MNRKKLEKHLRNHGCRRVGRKGGKHDIWANASNGKQTSVPRHTDVNTFTALGICEQLGIPIPSGR